MNFRAFIDGNINVHSNTSFEFPLQQKIFSLQSSSSYFDDRDGYDYYYGNGRRNDSDRCPFDYDDLESNSVFKIIFNHIVCHTIQYIHNKHIFSSFVNANMDMEVDVNMDVRQTRSQTKKYEYNTNNIVPDVIIMDGINRRTFRFITEKYSLFDPSNVVAIEYDEQTHQSHIHHGIHSYHGDALDFFRETSSKLHTVSQRQRKPRTIILDTCSQIHNIKDATLECIRQGWLDIPYSLLFVTVCKRVRFPGNTYEGHLKRWNKQLIKEIGKQSNFQRTILPLWEYSYGNLQQGQCNMCTIAWIVVPVNESNVFEHAKVFERVKNLIVN